MVSSNAVRVVVVASLLLIAGCAGGSSSPTPTETTTVTGPQPDISTPTQLSDVNASRVKATTVESVNSVTTYRVNGSVTRHLQIPTGDVEATVTTVGTVNRSARALHVAERTTGHMQNIETDTYVANETVYQRVVNHRTGSEPTWQTEGITDGQFRRLDPLARHGILLRNASVIVANRTTVRDEPAFEVYAQIDEEEYMEVYDRRLSGQPMNVTSIRFKYYTHRETGRLLEMNGLLQGKITQDNETAVLTEEYELTFSEYGKPVAVDVPENATAS